MIGTLPPVKGVQEYCAEQVDALVKKIELLFINFKAIYPEFLYPGGSTKEQGKTFKVITGNSLKVKEILTWYNPLSWAYAGIISEGKIIHYHWWTFYLFPVFFTIILLSKMRRKKIICTVHNVVGHENEYLHYIFSKMLFLFTDHFIVHSENNKKRLNEIYKIKKEDISVIPRGVLSYYCDDLQISKEIARKELGLNINDKICLFFGYIREYKGLDVLIESFAKVKEQIPNAKLLIAGKNWLNWDSIQHLIKQHDLEKEVIAHLKYIPSSEVKYYFLACDLVILPYKKFDAQSAAGNAAIAFHKPLIVTDVGGLPDLVKDSRAIARHDDPNDLAKKIIFFLKDEKLLDKLSTEAKDFYIQHSWDKIADMTIRIYEDMISRCNKKSRRQYVNLF